MSKFDMRKVYSQVSEIEVYYKRQASPQSMPKVSSSTDAEKYFRYFWPKKKMDHVEHCMVLYLNRSNRIMGWSRISLGGQSATVVDPKVVFQIALKANAASIIVAHNHPSGETNPSDLDISLTKKLSRGGKFLDLSVLDHIIISSESYYSMADEGLME